MGYGTAIVLGTAVGTAARFLMLRSDYRQYPSYPHGHVTHLSLGFIAAFLGAVAVPALVAREFTAATFLALAAQEFRQIRDMERKMLEKLEEEELVPRGADYIEGIARTFEARNYLTMLVALVTSSLTLFAGWAAGLAGGLLATWAAVRFFMRGEVVGDIAEVVPARAWFDGAYLKVGEVVMLNVGLPQAREKLLREGLAVLIKPKDDNARATLHNRGQRQAIVHTAAALIGTKREIGEQEWTPLARKHIDTGEIALFILPVEPDIEALIDAVKRVPVLESARRRPLATATGRLAQD